MNQADEDYEFDEESGEWLPVSVLAAKRAAAEAVEVRDAVGNLLADGDQVTLIKDLEVKGAGQTLKRGTLIKSIRLTGDPQEIDCRYEGIRGLVLRAEFVQEAVGPGRSPTRPAGGGSGSAVSPSRLRGLPGWPPRSCLPRIRLGAR